MKAQGQAHYLTIAAHSSIGPMQWPGTNFRVLEADGPFFVKFDESAFLPASIGLPYDTPLLDAFSLITFRNDNAVAVTTTIYAGNLNTRDERKIISGTVDVTLVPVAAFFPAQLVVTGTAAAPPKPLIVGATPFQKAVLLAKKSLDGTLNTGAVFLGPSSAADEQPYELQPGDEVILAPPVGQSWNLAAWSFTVATSGDGLVVIYS